METLRKRIRQIKERRPIYQGILDFYQKVREEQERIKTPLRTEPIVLKKEWKNLFAREGFPLVRKEDFPLDVESCTCLFTSLCCIAKEANSFMTEAVKKIEEAVEKKGLNLEELLREGLKDKKVEKMAKEFGLDQKVFFFLVQNSAKPSIEAGMKQVSKELERDTGSKRGCPLCGSLPYLALLGKEVGERSLLCSFCGYQWKIERFLCPFCNNREQGSLHYFYAEDEESYRVDLCEKCHKYIKTIDLRKTDVHDASLEDIATLHLDILASQKGYERPVSSLWINHKTNIQGDKTD